MSDYYDKDDKLGKVKDPLMSVVRWLKSRSSKEQAVLASLAGLLVLLLLWVVIEDHDTLFVIAESAHCLGIAILVWKLWKKKSCAGVSLRTQNLTALFLGIRLYCSFMMEYDIHTLLDLLTLVATLWVIGMMVLRLKDSWQQEADTCLEVYVAVPCIVLALVAKPTTSHAFINRVLWAFCVYMEAVSVLPQLRMMQKSEVVERFTGHYVFCLGISRFFSCAHWVLQLLDGSGYLIRALGSGLWPVMVLLSEVVQTFILADFCYYYVKSYAGGSGVVRLPSGVV